MGNLHNRVRNEEREMYKEPLAEAQRRRGRGEGGEMRRASNGARRDLKEGRNFTTNLTNQYEQRQDMR
jgi:hypothetical protein